MFSVSVIVAMFQGTDAITLVLCMVAMFHGKDEVSNSLHSCNVPGHRPSQYSS